MRRRWITGLAAGLVVAIAGMGPGLAVAQSPEPLDAGSVIGPALDAVRAHDSWRFEDRAVNTLWSGLETVTTGTVLREPAWRRATDISVEGETGWRQVVVGRKGWQNLYGGTFHPMKELGIPVPEPASPLPYEGLLLQAVAAGATLTQLEDEEHDGVMAHHYVGSTPVAASPVPSVPPEPGAFSATLELWVDATDGALLASTVDTAQAIAIPGIPTPAEYTIHEDVTISGFDDPTNTVVAPSLDVVGLDPTAGGDPTLAPQVLAAFTNLADLDSYRAVRDFLGNGYTGVTELTVDNGRPPAVQLWNTFRSEHTTGVLAIGRKRWTASGDAPEWKPAGKATATCPAPCTFASLSDLAVDLAGTAETYTLVSDDEELDGVPAIHLRSTAGREIAGFGIFPGTADLWIAKDGGHLLRDEFDGIAQRRVVTITGMDDPANALVAPEG